MKNTSKIYLVFLCLLVLFLFAGEKAPAQNKVRLIKASTVPVEFSLEDQAVLARPVCLKSDSNKIYVVDSQDNAIKIFSKTGKFLSAIGKQGRGPGELIMPSSISIYKDQLFVSDFGNRRIQVFDKSGKFIRSFKTPAAGSDIFVLDQELILLVHLTSAGNSPDERLLYLINFSGEQIGQFLPCSFTGDRVYDALKNLITVFPLADGYFIVTYRSDDLIWLKFNRKGEIVARIKPDKAYKPLKMKIPFIKGPTRSFEINFWHATSDGNFIYYLESVILPGEQDNQPGRHIYVFDLNGGLSGKIEIPQPVARFIVDGDLIFAVDMMADLKIFRIEP